MKNAFLLMLLLATMFTFTACGGDDKDNPQGLSQTKYEVFARETTPVNGAGLYGVVWKSSNKFVAEVEGDGTIVAHHVGSTSINPLAISGYIQVEVKPKVTEYSEPMIRLHQKYINGQLVTGNWQSKYLWGTNISMISYYIKESGAPWKFESKTHEIMLYSTGNKATPFIGYLFNGRELYATGIYVDPLYASQIPDFLAERFIVYSVDTSNYTADFAHVQITDNDEMTLNYAGRMAYSNSTGYILILYAEYVDSSVRTRSAAISDEMLCKFEDAVK